jgi:2-keto-4-pentenoate hydratase
LPARPATREEIADAIAGVLPGIELVDSRFLEWTAVGAPCLTADNACNAAWVRGRTIEDWRGFDLAGQATSVEVNGEVVRRGRGSAVLGHPLNAIEWLVKRLAERGLNLKAGQYVTTGVTTEVYNAARGDRIRADFGPVGFVEVEFY